MAKRKQPKSSPPSPPAPEAAPPPRRAPLLNITTLVERRTVEVDGVLYELKSPQEVSVFDRERLRLRGARLQSLMDRVSRDEELSDAELEEARDLLDFITRLVLVAPDDVQRRLTDDHRLALAQAFTAVNRQMTAPAGTTAVAEPTTMRTGARP